MAPGDPAAVTADGAVASGGGACSGTEVCPIPIARTSGRLVARGFVRSRCHALPHAPNIIARRAGRAPGAAVLRGQPRAAARARHERQRDAVPRPARWPVADTATRRLPDRERRAEPFAERGGRAALRRAGQPYYRVAGLAA